jgi:AcrR family transcriptional regulator
MVRGRPREFDTQDALDRVLAVFWRDGFDAASMQALADAVGVSKPSLYAAYGNKESLYLAALERYATTHGAERMERLHAEPDVKRAVHEFLTSLVDAFTATGGPPGCMIVAGTSACQASHASAAVQGAIRMALRAAADALEVRLRRAVTEGQLAPDPAPCALAAYIGTVMSGLSVQARGGASAEVLRHVVSTAMRAWP